MSDFTKYITRKRPVDLENAALIVIDMQRYFNDLTPSIINNINKLVDKFNDFKRPILYTQHYDASKDDMLSEWWPGENLEKDSETFQLVAELQVAQSGHKILKTTYDAFHNTDLDAYLKKHDVKDLVIVGVLTNCCCETTARSAFVKNYRVHVVPDANATYENKLHQASLSNLAYAFAYLPYTNELVAL